MNKLHEVLEKVRTTKQVTPSMKIVYPYKNFEWFGDKKLWRQSKEIDYQLLQKLKRDYTQSMNVGIETLYGEIVVNKQTAKYASRQAYREMRREFPWISSSIISCGCNRVRERFFDWLKHRREKSIPFFRSQPVSIPGNSYSIKQDENGYYYLDFRIFSSWAHPVTGTKHKMANRMKIGLMAPGHLKKIVGKLVPKTEKKNDLKVDDWKMPLLKRGKYIAGDALLFWDDRKIGDWAIKFTYEKEISQPVKSDVAIGIDLGINFAFYCAVSNSWKRFRLAGGKIKHKRNQMRKMKASLGDASRGGHGTRAVWKRKQEIGHHEIDFIRTRYHQITKMIIDFAVAQNASVIFIEDHSQLGECLITSWTPSIFYQFLKYKCNNAGIELIELNPAYSSQRCSNCGFIHKTNRDRDSGDWFKCGNCNFGHFDKLPKKTRYKQMINADYNAARNLSFGYEYDPKAEFNHHVDLLSKKINVPKKEIKDFFVKNTEGQENSGDKFFHKCRKEISDLILQSEVKIRSTFQTRQLTLL